MANRVFIGFLLLLLLALTIWGGIWFKQNFERQTEEIRSDFSKEARRNPLLAAERFLQRLGMQVESLTGREYLRTPPDQPGVLLVKDLGPSLAPQREQQLLDWVAGGGHLIATPGRIPAEDEAGNHLLETLGVRFIEPEVEDPTAETSPVEVMFPDSETTALVAFDPARSFLLEEARVYWEVPALEGYHLLRIYHGDGMITLLSDNRFFNNSQIDEHDHALFLAHLMDEGGQAWLLYSSQMPTLPRLLWNSAPYLVVSGFLWLAVLPWWLTYRSGPVLSQANADRRDLLEHLQASAEYLWKLERAETLQKRTREQVEKSWLRSHPLLLRMAERDRCEWLAERTGLSGDSIWEALYAEQNQERKLIEASANLQRLLLALHPEKQME